MESTYGSLSTTSKARRLPPRPGSSSNSSINNNGVGAAGGGGNGGSQRNSASGVGDIGASFLKSARSPSPPPSIQTRAPPQAQAQLPGGNLPRRSGGIPRPIPKQSKGKQNVLRNSKHRADSWGFMGAAATDAIFDGLEPDLLASVASADAPPPHPLRRSAKKNMRSSLSAIGTLKASRLSSISNDPSSSTNRRSSSYAREDSWAVDDFDASFLEDNEKRLSPQMMGQKRFSEYAKKERALPKEVLVESTTEKPEKKDNSNSIDDNTSGSRFLIIRTLKNLYKEYVFDVDNPCLNSNKLFFWSAMFGIFFGVFTAVWSMFIEKAIDVVWVRFPIYLLEKGIFTDLDGHLPLPHYIWIVQTIFGAVLSTAMVLSPEKIPGQDNWIEGLHTLGVLHYDSFLYVLVISSLAMMSGLSLGPETPLVLLSGMIGSFVGIVLRQNILYCRSLNMIAASAAIGGFFGFPMAGALFVLEVPHRMGLEYQEALSSSIFSSILAVLFNRFVTGNAVTGYFNYPFLATTLPSHVFYIAAVYGIIGTCVGKLYCRLCYTLKHDVHDLFHEEHHHGSAENRDQDIFADEESLPLVGELHTMTLQEKDSVYKKFVAFLNRGKKGWRRSMFVGILAGFTSGVICMFFPHLMFWGEGQLQSIIDRGRTPLPFVSDENIENITAYAMCMVEPEHQHDSSRGDYSGYTTQCYLALSILKIITVGVGLGTGIVGGQFWGPLFTGAAASYVITDICEALYDSTGLNIFAVLSAYPCVSLLCIMGATHVVIFRAHTAIMLILTLTVSSFEGEGGAGDYSAIFPLLVVSCFISLMSSRDEVFYKQQKHRCDLILKKEGLIEPLMPVDELNDTYSADDSSVRVYSDVEDDEVVRESDDFKSFKFGLSTEVDSSSVASVELRQQKSEKVRTRHRRVHSDIPNAASFINFSGFRGGIQHRNTGSFDAGSVVSDQSTFTGLRERARSRDMLKSEYGVFGELNNDDECLLGQATRRTRTRSRSNSSSNVLRFHNSPKSNPPSLQTNSQGLGPDEINEGIFQHKQENLFRSQSTK